MTEKSFRQLIELKFSAPHEQKFTNFTDFVMTNEKMFTQLHADCNRSLFGNMKFFTQAGFSVKVGQVIFQRLFVDAFANLTPEQQHYSLNLLNTFYQVEI